MMRRRIIWALAGILFAVASVALHSHVKAKLAFVDGEVNRIGNIAVGELAPDFSTLDIDGRRVALSDFQDRNVIVLEFWTTWCSSCDESLENFQLLNFGFRDRSIEFLSMNVGEDPQVIREYLEDLERKIKRRIPESMPWFPFTFHVLTDPRGEIKARYGLPGIPVLAIVGIDGRIGHIESGFPTQRPSAWRYKSDRRQRVTDKLESMMQQQEKHRFDGEGP